ncbi:MAG: CinA family protein [Novosphingobium sp.]|nr:CinA family protein [Novosphingobium sp.]
MSESREDLKAMAEHVLAAAKRADLMLATAESCTGGQLAALFTSIEGFSSQFDRGFVTYTARSKSDLLGIDPMLVIRHGEVSREVAQAMAAGALEHSAAGLVCAITGFAGPGEDGDETGLIHLAVVRKGTPAILRECHFGERGREESRDMTVRAALEMMAEALEV